VTIASGATSATFTVTTVGESSTVNATISATLSGTTKSAGLAITPAALSKLTIAPSSVGGGNSATGTVTLNGLAPTAGVTVTLSSSSTSATVPASVLISSGSSSATFAVSTKPVTAVVTATLTASFGGTPQTATLTIQPATLGSVSVSPGSVVGGSATPVVGSVMLTGEAATSGATVLLTSSNTALATVPASVKVGSGSSSVSFTVTHKLVTSAKTVTITASYGGIKQTTSLTLMPFQVVSLSFTPASVTGGTKSSGSVLLNAEPGTSSGPISVKLTSSSKSVTVPATVSVPTKILGAVFTATTSAVSTATTATVTASYGTSSQQAMLTVAPPTLISVTVSPTTVKGSATTAVTGTVSLSGPAPTGGLVITLSSSNTGAATVPATVTIAAGKATGTFKVTHKKVTVQTSVTLSATLAGTTKTTALTVTP